MLFYDMLQGANYYPQFDNHEMKPLQDLCKEINKHCLSHEGLDLLLKKFFLKKFFTPKFSCLIFLMH